MTHAHQPSDDIHIFVLNDHVTFLEALKRFLDGEPDLLVIGTGNASPRGLEPVIKAQPDVVILDPEIHDLEVGEMVRSLRSSLPLVRIIVLTLNNDDRFRDAALKAGADDFIWKITASDQLVPSIRRAKPKLEPGL